jgi:cytochrome c-type protein NapB
MSSHLKILIAAAAVLALMVIAHAQEAVDESKLGLSKTGVRATPDPIVPLSDAKDPGENETVEPYFPGSPPLISHQVDDFLPIRIGENMCMDCHDLPDEIGKERQPSDTTPMPTSHYTDLRNDPGEVLKKPVGARFICTQCHSPQTNAAPLVVNTYSR